MTYEALEAALCDHGAPPPPARDIPPNGRVVTVVQWRETAMRYLPQAGYAPRGLPDVLDDLQREDVFTARLEGRDRPQSGPIWARTHPLTTDRIRRLEQLARH